MIIDISHYNTITNWDEVKKNVEGVIIRCAYRGYGSGKIVADNKVNEYAQACVARGIPIGFYFMSQAINPTEAIEEADYTLELARKYKATLPLFIDSEDGDGTARVVRADGLSKDMRTAVCKAFCERVNAAGFVGGIYASESWYKDKLHYEQLKHFFIWVANYGKNTGLKTSTIKLKKFEMHQYTSRASIPGVKGNCDASEKRKEIEIPKVVDKQFTIKDLPMLKHGSKGKSVEIWQVICGTEPDGIFGKNTTAATVAWQKNYMGPEEADGIVGEKTWNAALLLI